MGAKILGKVAPTLTEYTLAYAVPTGMSAVLGVEVTNRGETDNTIYVAISGSDDLAIASVGVSNSGTGLIDIPTLTVVGTGVGAEASVTTLVLTALGIFNGGLGYVVGDTIALVGTNGTQPTATVTSVNASGTVTGLSIVTKGALTAVYTSDIETTGGSGTGLVIKNTDVRFGIGSVTVTKPGNDFTSTPTITASSGTGFTFDVQMTRAAIEDKDAIEWNVKIPPSGVLGRNGLTLSAGDAIFVKSSLADSLNTFVFGIEAVA